MAVFVGLLAVPALASAAETYVVNLGNDFAPEVAGCDGGPFEECRLREAIEAANEDPDTDTIEFSVEGVSLNSELPAIVQPVTIDGGSGPTGPGVELDGETEGSGFDGLVVQADGVTIRGLAINHFVAGVYLLAKEAAICENHFGIDLELGEAAPNSVGVWVGAQGTENGIGSGCTAGNVIAGNEWVGVLDEGLGTRIRRNAIGIDPDGDPLPNGAGPVPSQPSGGIFAGGEGTQIGGLGAGQGNTIAYNLDQPFFGGGGVIVSTVDPISIRGNSIHNNDEFGIWFRFGETAPPPALDSASSVEGVSTVVSGSVEGGPDETLEVDLFANAVCDLVEIGFEEFAEEGEGETYLGTTSVTTDGLGSGEFEVTVPVQAEGTVLTATATATEVATAATTAFSGCIVAPAPKPADPAKPGDPAKPPAIQSKVEPPVNGESVAVAPSGGTVFIRLPGQKKPVRLKEGQTIPVGSIIDATRGRVTLTSVNKAGETQTAVFYGGKFLVAQQEGSGLVVLKLRGGNLASCGAKGSAAASAKKGRRLWGSGKGRFRTEGNYGSATVRGTVWLTEDRCGATFFKVKQGTVSVRDFTDSVTDTLTKGESYLASP